VTIFASKILRELD